MTARLTLLVLLVAVLPARAQDAAAPASDLKTSINSLGSLDYATRTRAARQIRRATEADAVAALTAAVRPGTDEFVRYRALVLLTSFSERATGEVVRTLLGDRNDRLRQVAYQWLERHPDPRLADTLLAQLQTEQAEFVRPALVGALAAYGDNPAVQRTLIAEAGRGLDFFRTAVVDALGEHRAIYATDTIAALARVDGPIQEDAVLALGRVGGAKSVATITELSQGSGDIAVTAKAARCLAGVDCESEIMALVAAAKSPRRGGDAVRTAVNGLAAIAATGRPEALAALVSLTAPEPLRDAAAVGVGRVAVRQPQVMMSWLEAASDADRKTAIALLKDGFDALEEDFGEEQFFAAARAEYWKAGENSPVRTLMASIIDALEF